MKALKPGQAYRCTQCGTKTRFEVTKTVQTRYFHHQIIGGGMTPEDEEVLKETINSVICIYCKNGDNVVIEDVMEGQVTE